MKRVHRDCFIGSEAVEFFMKQGFVESRSAAEKMGQAMVDCKLIRHVTDSRTRFRDAYLYYRFKEDDNEQAALAASSAGNGDRVYLGQRGSKFSFAPHTAHNSYILDIALAEEIERAVAGANVEARAVAFEKLRARVREQALAGAPDWVLEESSEVNETLVSVYSRLRPRGDFKNAKITGMVGTSPKNFISDIMTFEKRQHWESMFEDGVVVEAIDLGEDEELFTEEDDLRDTTPGSPRSPHRSSHSPSSAKSSMKSLKGGKDRSMQLDKIEDECDLIAFLETVDVAGIPPSMPVAYLSDPDRQAMLANLRKKMMQADPQDCMLCGDPFAVLADVRFCPCCSMISCASCVSKRVFEVVTRTVVSVCVHCMRESTRIRYPPTMLANSTHIDPDMKVRTHLPLG
jgi:hypothetical protein